MCARATTRPDPFLLLFPSPPLSYLFVKLHYVDGTPIDYEPPHFRPLAGGEADGAHFPHKPFVLETGR